MAKRVRLNEPIGVRINETELGVMRLVAKHGQGLLVMSVSEMATELGKSIGSIRRCLKMLDSKGLVEVRERFLRNGGQLENEYELTEEGRRVIAAAEEAEGSRD